MKESLRNKLFTESVSFLNTRFPDIEEPKARKISSSVAENSIQILIENNKNLDESIKSQLLAGEAHKKMFRDHIESLQNETKLLLKSLKTMGVVYYEMDPKSKRLVLKSRTTVVADTVNFLNKLNTFVTDFYKEVYKIDEQNNEDRTQITLF
jgi:hypothetical protein